MECTRNLRQFNVTFATNCSQLVKMVSEPEKWPAFASYLEDIKILKRKFQQFKAHLYTTWPAFANYLEDIKILKRSFNSSELIHIPQMHNSRADSLARSAKKQPSFVVHMDAELLI